MRADVSGTREDYDISLSSDLEQVLQQAIGQILREKARGLKSKLRDKVMARAQEPLDSLDSRFGGLVDIKGLFSQRLENFDGLLSDLAATKGGVKLPL